MAKNLIIGQVRIVAIAAFAGVDDLHSVIGPKKLGIASTDHCLATGFSFITHVAAFASLSFQSAQIPGQQVAAMIFFDAASAVCRPSTSEALFYGGKFFYRVSWSDIGVKDKGRGLRYERMVDKQKRVIYFYRQETDPENVALLSKALENSKSTVFGSF